MKQMVYLFILLLMGTVATSAQSNSSRLSVRGRILNEERQPIEFANIVLLSTDSIFIEGTCSRSDGSFEIVPPTHEEYLLQITSIGYKSLCRSCRNGDTGDWILEADAIMLAETVVEAQRPVFRLKGGKLETNVQQSLLASLNNANDVLKHIPGLRHSDEGYTVFGKGTPIIYIDHRLLQDNSELERLSAADIEKVELITNPGAEYNATVNAVVRIRTVRGRENGFGGNVRASIT
ncbi:carboxypeptidase-like regulatory domain-containing protein, partial [Bacteroides heparinolyticus]